MKTFTPYILLCLTAFLFTSCSKDDGNPVANHITLHFNNTFENTTIVLGEANSTTATVHTSANGQSHHFSELKYVISNIRLVKSDGTEVPYHINDLDKGATVVNQAKPQTLDYVLNHIPVGEYAGIKFGLGVQSAMNTLDEIRFPNFYGQAGANDTKMHWEWGTGYRFVKIEGFYESDKILSIHTGSTVGGDIAEPENYTQGVDAYRDITLTLPTPAIVSSTAPRISIKADFDNLLSGHTNTITLGAGNATPSTHTAVNMVIYVDNLGGDGSSDLAGMFSIESVDN